jgi:hypothetical protein
LIFQQFGFFCSRLLEKGNRDCQLGSQLVMQIARNRPGNVQVAFVPPARRSPARRVCRGTTRPGSLSPVGTMPAYKRMSGEKPRPANRGWSLIAVMRFSFRHRK